MTALEKYLESKNSFNRIFGLPVLEVPTNLDEAKPLFSKLLCDLSPENLHCDGEISYEQAMTKKELFDDAWCDLEDIVGRFVTEDEAWEF